MKSNFPSNLSALRKSRGLSQAALAKMLDVSESTVQKWEKGINKTSLDDLLRIKEIFKIPLDILVGNHVDMDAIHKIGEISAKENGFHYETDHEIFSAPLKGNAVLHRYRDTVNEVEYSAIFLEMEECTCLPREKEYEVIWSWNEYYKEVFDETGGKK